MSSYPKVFLGGTCNGDKWRDDLVKKLTISYFNPVVENWTPADQTREKQMRANCDIVLYVITNRIKGVYCSSPAWLTTSFSISSQRREKSW